MKKRPKIDFKQPKYIIPIIVFVFANFMFYTISSFGKDRKEQENVVVLGENELQGTIGTVSETQAEKDLENKYEAYQQNYNFENRDAQVTAINRLGAEDESKNEFENLYADSEIERIRAEEEALKRTEEELRRQQREIYSGGYSSPSQSYQDDETMKMLQLINESKSSNTPTSENDNPMAIMKEQYKFLDSLERASNPEYQAQLFEEERQKKIIELMEKDKLSRYTVTKVSHNENFNTVMRERQSDFIKAIIDEDITGHAGSRLRIRLLEPIKVGNYQIQKNSYLYAIITGFNEQRVSLEIASVLYHNKILPIRLSLYDMDGLEGLYVPDSKFREFTKDIGGNAIQGMNMNTSTGDMKQQFFTSLIDRAFTSTSQSIANIIRKNKAKLKYNTFIYLIDKEQLDKSKEEIYKENINN